MAAEFRTIVGGRSRGDRLGVDFPRGIEVLLKKATVNPAFRKLLLEDPLHAAASIELDLGTHESKMLTHTPKSVLDDLISHTFVPKQLVATFRDATRAAVLVLALASSVVTPSLAAGGIETYPSYSAEQATLAVDRMAALQDALEEFCKDHGRYPETVEWLEPSESLLRYVGAHELYDPWKRQFHYEAVKERGEVVNYRLESLGLNEQSDRDNIPCPIGAMLHRFSKAEPITILYPEPDGKILIERGQEYGVVEFQARCDSSYRVFWWLDGELKCYTTGEHNRSFQLKTGKHVLVLADERDNLAGIRFFIACQE